MPLRPPLLRSRGWAVECQVELEDAGAVSEAGEATSVRRREAVAPDLDRQLRREVEQRRRGRRQFAQGCDAAVDDDAAALGLEAADKGRGDLTRAAARNRPAEGVARERQDEADGPRWAVTPEAGSSARPCRRRGRGHAHPRNGDGPGGLPMPGRAGRNARRRPGGAAVVAAGPEAAAAAPRSCRERLHEPAIGSLVGNQARRGLDHRPLQGRSGRCRRRMDAPAPSADTATPGRARRARTGGRPARRHPADAPPSRCHGRSREG